jgi:hypothetical protein
MRYCKVTPLKKSLAASIWSYLGTLAALLAFLSKDLTQMWAILSVPRVYITILIGLAAVVIFVIVRVLRKLKKVREINIIQLWRFISYAIGIIGIIALLLYPLVRGVPLEIVGYNIVGFGVGAIGIAVGIYSTTVAKESDRRIAAIANLEYYEKMAVIESYIKQVNESLPLPDKTSKEAFANRIFNDIKGAKELEPYVKPEVKDKLNSQIIKLKSIVSGKEPWKELEDRLQELLSEIN